MISEAQKTVLTYLLDGAKITPNIDRSRWRCVLPNGFTSPVRQATIKGLYHRKLIQQDDSGLYTYIISAAGRAVMAQS